MAGHPLAEEFFKEVVQPTVDEYLRQPQDIRRGRLAAIVLEHMVDYWHVDTGESKSAIRAALRTDTPILNHSNYWSADLIRDVADASKHARLNRALRMLTCAEQINSRHVGAWNTTTYNFVPYGRQRGADAEIKLDNGKIYILKNAVYQVSEAWRKKLGLPQARP